MLYHSHAREVCREPRAGAEDEDTDAHDVAGRGELRLAADHEFTPNVDVVDVDKGAREEDDSGVNAQLAQGAKECMLIELEVRVSAA